MNNSEAKPKKYRAKKIVKNYTDKRSSDYRGGDRYEDSSDDSINISINVNPIIHTSSSIIESRYQGGSTVERKETSSGSNYHRPGASSGNTPTTAGSNNKEKPVVDIDASDVANAIGAIAKLASTILGSIE